MLSLFQDIKDFNSSTIDGLEYHSNFISPEEEQDLIGFIDNQEWLNDLKRRVQHYGYQYDYKAKSISVDSYIGEIPKTFNFLIRRLIERNNIQTAPDQAIINEYVPGQGIAPHVDCVPCFGDIILSIS
ncbi:MAG: DNA repair protein [Pseudomonadota bacterium]